MGIQLPTCGYAKPGYSNQEVIAEVRRWLVLLGVVICAYALIASGWLTSFFVNAETNSIREPEYTRYWAELFGPNALVTYRLQYACGHQLLVAEPDLTPELLKVAPHDMELAVHAMQLEPRLDDVILMQGEVKADCPDCQTHFWVGEQDGCVAVWRGKDRVTAVLLQRFEDMSVTRLPMEVQQQLREGILVHSEDELALVLEGLDR